MDPTTGGGYARAMPPAAPGARSAANAALLVLLLALAVVTEGRSYALLWTLLFAPLSMLLSGGRAGLRWTAAFYAALLPLCAWGIGRWQHGRWEMTSFLQLLTVSGGLCWATYALRDLLDHARLDLRRAQQREQELVSRVSELQTKDPATGLCLGRDFASSCTLSWRRADRYDLSVAFFMVEIDQRSVGNGGTGALRTVAEILDASFQRPDDLLFRLGERELGGLVLTRDVQQVAAHLDGVRREIEERGSRLAPKQAEGDEEAHGGVTISASVTLSRGDGSDSAQRLHRRATDSLARARAEGGNRVVIDTAPLSIPPPAVQPSPTGT